MSWLLDAYSDRRTYGSVLYSFLGLPIGILGFTVVVVGLAAGIGFLITLIGIPILVGTLLFVQALVAMERRLAWSLLDASMPRRPPTNDAESGLWWQRLRELVTRRRTWIELSFVLLRLPLGIVGFVIVTTVLGLMIGGFAMPVLVAVGVESNIGSWTIDTFPESLFYLPISLLFLFVGPRILLGWGGMSGRIATHFLGVVETVTLKRAVTETLARRGEADGFAVLDELELRLGTGPFVTPTRVESTLLALEAAGLVSARWRGQDKLYMLGDNRMQKKR